MGIYRDLVRYMGDSAGEKLKEFVRCWSLKGISLRVWG
jgi:hypothetical protein